MGQEKTARTTRLVQYIVDSLHRHNIYATGYYLCEVFNFINVVSKHYILDKVVDTTNLNFFYSHLRGAGKEWRKIFFQFIFFMKEA